MGIWENYETIKEYYQKSGSNQTFDYKQFYLIQNSITFFVITFSIV